MRVLLVEDDVRVAQVVKDALVAGGHQVNARATCHDATRALDEATPDLAIFDVGLPDGSGIELCRSVRAAGHVFPILVLTARNGLEDRVAGLDAGADDYLGKPFSPSELSARVRALGRRGPRWTESVRTFGVICIDMDRRVVVRDGVRVPLTPRELDVVSLLAWRNGRVVPKDELLEAVWGDASEGAAASLEVLVARVRRKLDDARGPSCIRTVRQLGYAWEIPASKPG